jgi:hypothetical protein
VAHARHLHRTCNVLAFDDSGFVSVDEQFRHRGRRFWGGHWNQPVRSEGANIVRCRFVRNALIVAATD